MAFIGSEARKQLFASNPALGEFIYLNNIPYQVIVKDAGPNGTGLASCPPTCGDGDETQFLRQGIFIP